MEHNSHAQDADELLKRLSRRCGKQNVSSPLLMELYMAANKELIHQPDQDRYLLILHTSKCKGGGCNCQTKILPCYCTTCYRNDSDKSTSK